MKVKIIMSEDDSFFLNIEMPIIPRKGESIGFWNEFIELTPQWTIATIKGIVYECDNFNRFECVEITI